MSSKLLLSAATAALFACSAAAAQPAASTAAQKSPAEAPAADAKAQEAQAAAPGSTLPWPHIEQVRRGNRVVEVKVTGPKGDVRYTMDNREGRPPLSTQDLSSGLSTPRFFKFEF